VGVEAFDAFAGRFERVGAAHGVAAHRAHRRPAAHQEQVLGQAPGAVGLEHVVLEHEVLGVGPVVGDLAAVVVAHHVGFAGDRAHGVVGVRAGRAFDGLGGGDEAVHRPACDVGRGGGFAVRAAVVDVGAVVDGGQAAAGRRVG